MKMKHLNSQVKEGRIQSKVFRGAKANQLNHYVIPTLEEFNYDCAIIHVGINDILQSKDVRTERPSEKLEEPVKVITLVRYMLVQFYRRPELALTSFKLTKP